MRIQASHSSTHRRLHRAIPYGLMALLAFALAYPAQAQMETFRLAPADTIPSAEAPAEAPAEGFVVPSSTWQSNFDEQAAHMLREKESASIRNTVLHDIIVVATRGPNAIDLSTTVGALLQICKNDPGEQRRLMAIQALHAIGTEHASDRLYHRAMDRLYRIMQDEPSKHVRQVAATVLDDFYTTGTET